MNSTGLESPSAGLVSFHPHVRGNVNFALSPGKRLSGPEMELLGRAGAAVVPQNVKAAQYSEIDAVCARVFPDYRHRFGFEGKCGNFRLFESFGLPHPETRVYADRGDFLLSHPNRPPFGYPLVIKADRGGGGNGIFLVKNARGLAATLAALEGSPFVAQRFVEHRGADLRVVILGDALYPYWRVQDDQGEFRNNVGRGARIVYDFEPVLTVKGVQAATLLRQSTGINCAAVDVLFDRSEKEPQALLGEINFVFGRKGMNGSGRFRELFQQAVDRWIQSA